MSDLPEWDGDLKKLPVLGSRFIYKGKRFLLKPCDCPCKKVTAINLETEEFDLVMTIRVRNNDQGNPLTRLLIDLGKTSHEVADSLEKDGLVGLLKMREELLALDPVGHGLITAKALFMAQFEIRLEMGV